MEIQSEFMTRCRESGEKHVYDRRSAVLLNPAQKPSVNLDQEKLRMSSDSSGWTQVMYDAYTCYGHGGGGGEETSSGELENVVEPIIAQRRPSVHHSASKYKKSREDGVAPEAEARYYTKHHFNSVDDGFRTLDRILEELRGRLVGRDKDDVEKALSAAEALEVMCFQSGSDRFAQQEREQMRKLVLLSKNVADESKEILEESRSVAWELEAARETVTKLQNVLQGELQGHVHEQLWEAAAQKKELEELKSETQEARRIKMLHESSGVTDLERQIRCLRQQLLEKAAETVTLRRLVELIKDRGGRDQNGKSLWYEFAGDERLGSTLSIVPINNRVIDLSKCAIQWCQITNGGKATNLISGAIRPEYAPEPLDVGKILCAEINILGGKTQALQTSGHIKRAPGLDAYVDSLAGRGGAQFSVRIVIKNGEAVEKQPLYTFDVHETRIKLYKRHILEAVEEYSTSMQLCGARGGGDSAAFGLFWVPKTDQSFLLVLESERERNAAIMLARKLAKLQNIVLGRPGDTAEGGSFIQMKLK